MREGVNPEKFKDEKNVQKFHRIIVPIYIPDSQEEYYKGSFEVLKTCLESIAKTINYETTAITIINNGSSPTVAAFLASYLNLGLIDKLISYSENQGKVYSVFAEARGSYEPFITITDGDVLFFEGWESAVFDIYKAFPKSGVVSPLPLQNLAFNKNNSVFFDNFLLNKIRYEKIVSDKDCELFLKGMGNSALLKRNNRKYSWKEKQYFLKRKVNAILGAGHFVATYRKEVFKANLPFPVWKFKNGFEDLYLDEPTDKFGWYRLSTSKSFAYHLGNRVDDISENLNFEEVHELDKNIFAEIQTPLKSKVPYPIKKYFFRVLKKFWKL